MEELLEALKRANSKIDYTASNKLVTEDTDIKGVEINFSLANNEKSCKIKTS